MGSPSEITSLLDDWRDGREDAFERLFSLVYDELRALAASYMRRERPDHTLQATALVNEAYLKLAGRDSAATPQNRLHFFAVAAKVMRQILIDHARSRRFEKRGGGAMKVPLEEVAVLADERAEELLALDEALERLAAVDARKAHVVELRFFGGLTIEEAAEVVGVSFNTAVRDWEMARAWLFRSIHGDVDGS